MSVLKQNKPSKKPTTVITARIQTELHDSFKEYCEENGFTVSEAIKLLIENELKGDSIQDVYKPEDKNVYDGKSVDMFDLGSYVIAPEVQVKPLSREDVDPLGMYNDEEVEILLKEAREIRGE